METSAGVCAVTTTCSERALSRNSITRVKTRAQAASSQRLWMELARRLLLAAAQWLESAGLDDAAPSLSRGFPRSGWIHGQMDSVQAIVSAGGGPSGFTVKSTRTSR